MKREQYIQDIILQLGGQGVKIELMENDQISKLLDLSLSELQAYINITKLATLQYAPCIDLSECAVQTVQQVFRTDSYNDTGSNELLDAIYLSFSALKGWSTDSMSQYRSYLRTQQIKNTLKTDLSFRWDEMEKKLYVSANYPMPNRITIQYIPLFKDVEEINSTYWEDKLRRLALAHCKIVLGRIRGKYTLSNAPYTLDADTLLEEGNNELKDIRDQLQNNNDLVLPID
jgi:hypothetical protein